MENKIQELDSKMVYLNELKKKDEYIELISLNTGIDKSKLTSLPAKTIANYAISLLSYGFLDLDEPKMIISPR